MPGAFNPAAAVGVNPDAWENSQQMMEDLEARAASGDREAARVLRGMRQAMASGRGVVAPPGQAPQQPAQPAQPAAPRPAPPRPAGFQRPRAMAAAGPLDGVIDRVEDAIKDENSSRVSQLREMRRMQHEKEIEQIRAQAALERVRQARRAEELSSGGVLGPGLIDLTGTARRIG